MYRSNKFSPAVGTSSCCGVSSRCFHSTSRFWFVRAPIESPGLPAAVCNDCFKQKKTFINWTIISFLHSQYLAHHLCTVILPFYDIINQREIKLQRNIQARDSWSLPDRAVGMHWRARCSPCRDDFGPGKLAGRAELSKPSRSPRTCTEDGRIIKMLIRKCFISGLKIFTFNWTT